MTRKQKNIFLWVGVLILAALYIFYNHSFIRTSRGNSIERTINAVPYTSYFNSEQQKPTSFFTAPAFPEYTTRCHTNKKLCTIMPLQQLYADMQWLGSIQFVGGQLTPDGLNGLSTVLDNMTNLAPYRDYPYVFGQLLIPQQRVSSADKKTTEKIEKSRKGAGELAKKGIIYTCNQDKIDKIMKLSSSGFLETVYDTGLRSSLENPCKSYENPYYAGFNAFYYSNDSENAAKYYKLAAFNQGAPTMAPLMAALVYGRGGEHLKSAVLRFDRYNDIKQQAEYDEILAKDADKALKKAVMEIQLQLLTEASQYVLGASETLDNNALSKLIDTDSCASSYTCLQQKGAIQHVFNNSYKTLCNNGTNIQNVRCEILALGIKNKWITLNGNFTYPFGTSTTYTRDSTYKSRWIQTK